MAEFDFSTVSWRKSSRSGGNGGNCVELGTVWRKSSRSGGEGGNCVELADTACHVAVRDSKHPAQPALAVTRTSWTAFATATRTRRFDLA